MSIFSVHQAAARAAALAAVVAGGAAAVLVACDAGDVASPPASSPAPFESDDSGTAASDAGATDAASSADGGLGAPTFTNVYASIISNRQTGHCTNCHGGSGNLDMSTQAKAYMNLVGSGAVTEPDAGDDGGTDGGDASVFGGVPVQGNQCGPADAGLRVDPGHPESSVLYSKVHDSPPVCGMQMPLGGPVYLSPPYVQLIHDWIAAGAPND